MKEGVIPDDWRTAKIKILYKGKGDTTNPNSYRGIALENAIFKIFTKILTNRLEKEVEAFIPEYQFGFRKGKSTQQAIKNLRDEIETAINKPKGKHYTVFIDYQKAFDRINRQIIISKLENMIGKNHPISITIRNILAHNKIEIDV